MRKRIALLMSSCLIIALCSVSVYGAGSERDLSRSQQQSNEGKRVSAIFHDIEKHWAAPAITHMAELNLVNGYADGNFRPNQQVTRAEFATILYRLFGFTGEAAKSFEDVTESAWYYEAVVRANGSGIMLGKQAAYLAPEAPITREEAAVMIDRAFQLSHEAAGEQQLQQYADYDQIAEYSKRALAYLVNEQIMDGYAGKLQPKAAITRAETAQLLYAMVADMVDASRLYADQVVEGNLVIRAADVTLKDVVIRGNLLLTEGIDNGQLTLDGVTVTGHIIIMGGGLVTLTDVKANTVIVNKQGEPVELLVSGESGAAYMVVRQPAHLGFSATSSLGSVIITASAVGTTIDAKGVIDQLIVDASGVIVNGEVTEVGSRTKIAPTSTKPNPGTGYGGNPTIPTTPPGEKPVAATTIPDHQWELIWQDEFNQPNIDASKWTVMDTSLVYNNELQYYSPNNTSIVQDNGRSVLQIEAKKGGYDGKEYSSGKLVSMGKGDWTYGKVVVRAKLPIQQGMWPAIWMMPTDEAHYGGWPASGEIDIMELIGGEHNQNQSRVYSTLHFDSKGADGSHGHDQGSTLLPDGQTFADDYHDFQVEWLPGVIRFYVDGNLHHEVSDWQTKAAGQPEYYTYPAPFDRPFYLILNLAVGGDWPGSPSSDFESETMKVDFVRVYAYKDMENWPNVTGKPAVPVQKREPQADGNHLYNHQFTATHSANGVPDSWEFIENAGGDGAVDVIEDEQKGKVAQISITQPGTENYSIQLTQLPIYVEKNKKYRVMFEAKASAARSIMSKVTQFQKNWTNYSGEKTFELSTEWQSYAYEFDMRAATDNNARFEFNLGLHDETVYVTNVRLLEIGEAEPLPEQPVERTPLLDGNLIYNGTFDQGQERLAFWERRIASTETGVHATISVNNFLQFPIMERQLVVEVEQSNGDPQSVVVAQPDLQLEANTTYGLYYEAKADAPRAIAIDLVGEATNEIQILQGEQVQLNTELTGYTGEIYIGAGTEQAAYELQLLFGGERGTVYVDNVRLVKRGAPVSVAGYTHIAATEAWLMQGLQFEASSEGGKHVAYMDQGDLLRYKIEAKQSGDYILSARLASDDVDSQVQFQVKKESGEVVATADIQLGSTGGWQTYETIYFPTAALEAGHTYFIDFAGADYNTRWVDLSPNLAQDSDFIADLSEWSSQLALEQGKHYRLDFAAIATAPKNLQVLVSQADDPSVIYMEDQVEIGLSKQLYSYTFAMTEPLDAAAVLVFSVEQPDLAVTLSLANIRLYEVNASADQGGQPIGVNLISNGNFSSGSEGWLAHAAGDPNQLKMQVVQNQLQAVIDSAGDNPWDRQVIYEGFAIEQGDRYQLTFTAKAEKARKLGLGIGWTDVANNYQWHGYFNEQVELTEEAQTFQFTFDVTNDSYAESRISFDMGNLAGGEDAPNRITLSDIRLVNMGAK